jgi:SAM-dependent methyltransferase
VALSDLQLHAPEMLSRKIPRANIQQAFALDTAERVISRYPEARVLAVGSYEDTAAATLRSKGYRLDEIDPNVNGLDLQTFYGYDQGATGSYDVILCVSVLKHVEDDVMFIQQVSELLAPDGIAIFTVDFSDRYAEHGCQPSGDFRLYTSTDLRDRLMRALPACALLDPPSWHEGEDDFAFDGCRYSFAGWVFRRLSLEQARYVSPTATIAATPWRRSLAAFTEEASSLRAQHQSDRGTIAAREAEIAALTAEVAQQSEQKLGLAAACAELQSDKDSLYGELRLDAGPRSLRVVLPLARMIRRIAGT